MNGCERIRAALRGTQPDRVPVMLHNFLTAAREAGISQRRFREDPAAIAESFIRAVESYEYDGILVDVDTVTLAEVLGVKVDKPEDQPARWAGPAIDSLSAAQDLPPIDVGSHPRIQVWLDAVRRIKAHFRNEIFVRGNCDQAAFSLASMVRGPVDWMMDLTDEKNHADARALLSYCTEAAGAFIRLMAETGADMISNGDSPAGPDLVSPAFYRAFAQPYERRLVEEAHSRGLPYTLHICGDTTRILDAMLETGASTLPNHSRSPLATSQLSTSPAGVPMKARTPAASSVTALTARPGVAVAAPLLQLCELGGRVRRGPGRRSAAR